jgi:hypothetical protein
MLNEAGNILFHEAPRNGDVEIGVKIIDVGKDAVASLEPKRSPQALNREKRLTSVTPNIRSVTLPLDGSMR